MLRKPLIIAHRGTSSTAPENTQAAFALAIEEGCHMIELDVHMTADQQIVVCHDTTLDRTTDCTGTIALLNYDQIKQCDAGSWFHAQFKGQYIPLLEEVLQAAPAEVAFNIEIKDGEVMELTKRVVEILQSTNRLEQTVISSFQRSYLETIKRAAPTIRIGLLYSDVNVSYEQFEAETGLELYSLHPNHPLVTNDYMLKARAAGKVVFPWTIDEEARWKELIELQVDGIITNCPGQFKALVDTL